MRATTDHRFPTMVVAIATLAGDSRAHHTLISLPLIRCLLDEPHSRYRLPLVEPVIEPSAPQDLDEPVERPRVSRSRALRLARAVRKAEHEAAVRTVWRAAEERVRRDGPGPTRMVGVGRF